MFIHAIALNCLLFSFLEESVVLLDISSCTKVILAAIERFPSNSKVLQACCRALGSIALIGELGSLYLTF